MSNQEQNGKRSSSNDAPTDENEDIYRDQAHQIEVESADEVEPPAGANAGEDVDSTSRQDSGQDSGQLQARIGELEAEVAKLGEQFLMAQAEMQNVRRRAQKDVENAHKFGLEKLVGELVNVADNLERAVAAIDPDNDACRAVGEGVELTLKSFMGILQRFHVEQVDPKGAAFNPEQHQAVTTVPNNDLAPNTVIDVFQKGYLLSGRLLRPAMVVVSRKSESGDTSNGQ